MDPGQSSSSNGFDTSDIRDPIIQTGDSVLLKLPNGDVRSVKVDKDTTITLGRVGSFHANDLIKQPYGLAYEIVDKKLKVLPPRSLDEVGMSSNSYPKLDIDLRLSQRIRMLLMNLSTMVNSFSH